jgi:hypothetical protein
MNLPRRSQLSWVGGRLRRTRDDETLSEQLQDTGIRERFDRFLDESVIDAFRQGIEDAGVTRHPDPPRE